MTKMKSTRVLSRMSSVTAGQWFTKLAPRFALAIFCVATISACDKKNDSGNGNTANGGMIADVPSAPIANQCLQTYSSNQPGYTQMWTPYERSQIRPYSWSGRNGPNGRVDRRRHRRPFGRAVHHADDREDSRRSSRGDIRDELHRYANPDRPNEQPDEQPDEPTDAWVDEQENDSIHGDGRDSYEDGDSHRNSSRPPPLQNQPNTYPPNAGGAGDVGGNVGNSPVSYPASGLCGCQASAGYVPACGPQGLTCVPIQPVNGALFATWAYNNGQFVFSSYADPYSSYGRRGGRSANQGCPTSVAQICTQPGVAYGNSYCQQLGQGPFGVWIQRLGR